MHEWRLTGHGDIDDRGLYGGGIIAMQGIYFFVWFSNDVFNNYEKEMNGFLITD